MKSTKSFAIAVLAIFGGVALAGCFHQSTPSGNVIKIGALLSTTGDLAAFGPDMLNAAKLAAKQVNDAGGVKFGGKTYTIEIVHADDGTSQTAVVGAADKLITQEKVVAIVGSLSSGVTLAALPKAKDASVPMVSPASTSPTLANQSVTGGWFFRVPPSDALQGRVMASLLQERTAVKVNSIYINNDYGKGFNDVMRGRLPTGALGTSVAYSPTGTTFTSEVTQVCGGTPAPDSIVLIGYPDTGGSILKAAEQSACTSKKWYFSEGLYDSKFVTNAGKDDAGNFVAAGFEGTTPHFGVGSSVSDFTAAYKAAYNNDEPGLFSAETYDGVMWIILAIQKAGSTSGASIKGAIASVVNKDANDQNATKPADALKALQESKGIDWNGPAHNFDIDANNEPKNGLYAYWRVKTDGTLELTKQNIFV